MLIYYDTDHLPIPAALCNIIKLPNDFWKSFQSVRKTYLHILACKHYIIILMNELLKPYGFKELKNDLCMHVASCPAFHMYCA